MRCPKSIVAWFIGMLLFLSVYAISYPPCAWGAAGLRAEAERTGASQGVVRIYLGYDRQMPSTLVWIGSWDASLISPAGDKDAPGSWIQLSDRQKNSGVSLEAVYYPNTDNDPRMGCLVVAVYRPQDGAALPAGHLFSFFVEISEVGLMMQSIPINAASEESAPIIQGRSFFSSAASAVGKPLPICTESVALPVNCIPPPPPEKVRTSVFNWDKIRLRWSPSDNEEPVSYFIYRSDTRDPELAIPLSNQWIADLVYEDHDLELDENNQAFGCSCGCSQSTFFYWVRARSDANGCVSALSRPAKGIILKALLPLGQCGKQDE